MRRCSRSKASSAPSRQGRTRLAVLRGVDLEVREGEMVALVGPSGSGKSTLLHIAGLLESPSAGTVAVAGEPCGDLNDDARTAMRRHNIGFVYQYHHLLPEFSALENVVIPQIIAGHAPSPGACPRQGTARLAGSWRDAPRHRPGRLSGGEQQRVAIARALANAPKLLSRRRTDRQPGSLTPPADVLSGDVEAGRAASGWPPWWPPTTRSWRRAWTASCASRAACCWRGKGAILSHYS